MVDHVVSTKLSEEDLVKLMDACKRHQCTTSKLVKLAITTWIELEKSKKEDLTFQLKGSSPSPKLEEKHFVKEDREISVDEAYFQYFRSRIDACKDVESH